MKYLNSHEVDIEQNIVKHYYCILISLRHSLVKENTFQKTEIGKII